MTKYSGNLENFEAINERCPNCHCQSYVILEEEVRKRRCTSCGAIYKDVDYSCTIDKKEEAI